jgi:phage terminase large subunit-like protein
MSKKPKAGGKNRTVRKPGERPRWYLELPAGLTWEDGDPAAVFCRMVATDPQRHCRWVHLACRRHVLDWQAAQAGDGPWVYRPELAARVVDFAAQFRGVEGPLAGSPLVLLPWQAFVVAMLWGWRKRDDPRKRRFAYGYVTVPRKNGKTGFVAALGLYQLAFPPPGSRVDVYSVATKEEQAKIVWRDGCRLLKTAAEWARRFRARHKSLTHGPSESEWRPLGSDSDTLDGLRPELALADELHAWRDRKLWDVIDSAFGAAFSPLMLAITTSGDNPDGICMEQEKRVKAVLEAVEAGTYDGAVGDGGNYFGAVWTIDDGDDWQDEAAWAKANPSLGSVKELGAMRTLVTAAAGSAGSRRNFLIKQLNVWQTTGPERWLDHEKWELGTRGVGLLMPASWERLRGRRCWGGIDLASTTDTSAWCMVAEGEREGELWAAWRVWLPGEDLAARSARDNVPYDLWAREEWLTLTPGDVIDVNQIVADVVAQVEASGLEVGRIAYDPGWSQGVGVRLADDHGLPMLVCLQRYSTLTAPLLELERLVGGGLLDHGGNPVARAHALAARLQVGGAGGMLLAKGRSAGRIDALAALAMALAARREDEESGGGMVGVFTG